MTEDGDIRSRITALVGDERALRTQASASVRPADVVVHYRG